MRGTAVRADAYGRFQSQGLPDFVGPQTQGGPGQEKQRRPEMADEKKNLHARRLAGEDGSTGRDSGEPERGYIEQFEDAWSGAALWQLLQGARDSRQTIDCTPRWTLNRHANPAGKGSV